MKNTDNFHDAKEAITLCYFSLSAKVNGTHWYVHEEFIVHTAVYQKAPLRLK